MESQMNTIPIPLPEKQINEYLTSHDAPSDGDACTESEIEVLKRRRRQRRARATAAAVVSCRRTG